MTRAAIFIASTCIFIACSNSQECTNYNPVLSQNGYTTPQYKDELLRRINLAAPNAVHYRVENYKEVEGKPFMEVRVESDSLCGMMLIDIKNPNKVADFKNVKGISYRGAEIKGLQYLVDTANGKYNFVWQEGIIID